MLVVSEKDVLGLRLLAITINGDGLSVPRFNGLKIGHLLPAVGAGAGDEIPLTNFTGFFAE